MSEVLGQGALQTNRRQVPNLASSQEPDFEWHQVLRKKQVERLDHLLSRVTAAALGDLCARLWGWHPLRLVTLAVQGVQKDTLQYSPQP